MTREIKFRAWDTDDKVYYLNALPVPVGLEYHFPYDGHVLLEMNDKHVFEQYTGLKDKNGREIYEGDIIRAGLPAEVIFKDGAFVLRNNLIDNGALVADILQEFPCEVIGNIHENQELLS